MNKKRKAARSLAKLSALDDLLETDGKLNEFEAAAIKEILAWQIEQRGMNEAARIHGLASACRPGRRGVRIRLTSR
jgi:hypothetical protein